MVEILVIKLSALGDFVQAIGPFQAIRAHHRPARLVLLTTGAYESFAEALGIFDEIWIDDRPKAWRLGKMRELGKRLNSRSWHFVYDLQTSRRSSGYFKLLARPRPNWSGVARGCSHPHANDRRDLMHTIDRQAEQLRMAGIANTPPPDLDFADRADLSRFDLPERYALMVPGGAPSRPRKRWPVERYREFAVRLGDRGLPVVAIGADAERDVLDRLARSGVRTLVDRTSLVYIVALGRRAVGAVGNDTGPMHLLSAGGCASVALFSHDSDPALCAPRGRAVRVLREPDLENLTPETVLGAFDALTGAT